MSAREFCYQIEREGYQARIVLLVALVSLLAITGCNNANGDPASLEAPPAAKVIVTEDANLFTVDHPEQFPHSHIVGDPDNTALNVSWREYREDSPSTDISYTSAPADLL
jgi:hypothetical protein